MASPFANDRLMLAYNVEAGFIADARPFDEGVTGTERTTTFRGLSLYAKYQLNDWFSVAGRGEYVHSDDGAVPNAPLTDTADAWQNHASSYDLWSYTLTLGFDLWKNLITRLEYRVDWGNEAVAGGDSGDADGPAHRVAAEVASLF